MCLVKFHNRLSFIICNKILKRMRNWKFNDCLPVIASFWLKINHCSDGSRVVRKLKIIISNLVYGWRVHKLHRLVTEPEPWIVDRPKYFGQIYDSNYIRRMLELRNPDASRPWFLDRASKSWIIAKQCCLLWAKLMFMPSSDVYSFIR